MAKAKDSLNERLDKVQSAVSARYDDTGLEPRSYAWCRAVYDDHVVFRKGEKTYSLDYTLDADGAVVLGDKPTEVVHVETFEPVKRTGALEGLFVCPLDEAGHMLEAGNTAAAEAFTGRQWGVIVIQEGMSKNRNRYPKKVLEAAVPLYEGAKVYEDHVDPAQRSRFGRSVRDCVGFLKDVKGAALSTQEATGAANGTYAVMGTLVVTKEAWQKELLAAYQAGNPNLYGLSHDVSGRATAAIEAATGLGFYDMQEIQRVDSVDLVTNPAAGGRVMRVVASDVPAQTLQGDERMLKQLIEAIRQSGHADLVTKLEGLGAEPNETGVLAIMGELTARARKQEAVVAPVVPVVAPVVPTTPVVVTEAAVQVTEAQILDVAADGRQSFLEAALAGCSLPDVVKDHVRGTLATRITEATSMAGLVTKAQITEAIRAQVDLFGKLADAKIVLPGGGGDVRITKDSRAQFTEAMDAFFDPTKPAQSFRNLYVQLTGDTLISGRVKEAVRLTESLATSSFGEILGDSITRRMLAEYKTSALANWRGTIAEVVPVSDFRVQRRMRFGGYPNLATISEGGPYPALTSPTDEEATYSPAKRGGTESLTMEMITNDDVGSIRRIPGRIARAAAQTLQEFVWDFLATNAAIYDSVALAASGHSNIVTTALSGSNLSSLRLKMLKQADMSNGKRLGLLPKYLIGPSDLEDLIFQLTGADKMLPDSSLAAQAAPAAPNPIARYSLQPLIVPYWTDANDYWLTSSIDQTPMIEIGFLGGREEPEMFVQDQPTQGSMFTNDKITYKIRHTYGGGVVDFRGFAAGIVP